MFRSKVSASLTKARNNCTKEEEMILLLEKEIDLKNSKVLYSEELTEAEIAKNWEVGRGKWRVNDGWLEGSHPENNGGLIYTKQHFHCNAMMEFEGRTVPPSDHDLNFVWCTEGWDKKTNDNGTGYIAGLGGWYENKTGIEHYPECKTQSITSAFKLETGRTYKIQAGSIDGHCFIIVDGNLIIEVFDPDPIDYNKCGKVGFGVYASHIQFRNLKVYEINWRKRNQAY